MTSFVVSHLIWLDTGSFAYYKPCPDFPSISADLEEETVPLEAGFPSAHKSSVRAKDRLRLCLSPAPSSVFWFRFGFSPKFKRCAGICLLAQESVPC